MRKGKAWETKSRKWLQEHYPQHFFFKLINPERIDWFGIGKDIMLVESKHVQKVTKRKQGDVILYYPKENARKREQLRTYFRVKGALENIGYGVRVALLLCKGKINKGEISFIEVETYDEIKTRY